MPELYIYQYLHTRSDRDYLSRVDAMKPSIMEVSSEFGFDYWDGDRSFGYGGYRYIEGLLDGFIDSMIDRYELSNSSSIIDLGCGKGFMLAELKKRLPGAKLLGLERSDYAISNAHEAVKANIKITDCRHALPFSDEEFDLAFSTGLIHNFQLGEAFSFLREIKRISRQSYFMTESYKTVTQMFNLQCWALTARTLVSTQDWRWLMDKAGYDRDYEFIYFN